jgi:hypothetical protein
MLLSRQGSEAAGRRCVEFGPVNLLLQPVISFVPDRSFRAQVLERLPLFLDRDQAEFVMGGRGLGMVGIFRDGAGGGVFLADSGGRI